ncbi:unnamed protein product [Blepharisma stoltei]|uniref:MINDY deubiquitinase domain-containing protein n=1 Tax=Blepharisma stoltei TaxID=1481888 RepID=A0AAU9JW22_9CILI|nr:unnamed protein product [Blepharisma stoltei]
MDSGYWLKEITYEGRKYKILLQSYNGPCPLLAIANVLILRGELKIHSDYSNVTHDMLTSLVANVISNSDPNLQRKNTLAEVAALRVENALILLTTLQVGLDVNVRFNDIHGFEHTPESDVFLLLNIPLLHGWIVDPQTEASRAIGDLSYNQLQEVLVSCIEIEGKQVMTKEDWELKNKGKLIEEFLSNSASQLTEEGLKRLKTELEDGKLYVLFRNNHFSTLLKRKGEIYLLATDLGFREAKKFVWEHMDAISGNNKWCDSEFNEVEESEVISFNSMNQQSPAPHPENYEENMLIDEAKQKNIEEDASLALALALAYNEEEWESDEIKKNNEKEIEEMKKKEDENKKIEDEKQIKEELDKKKKEEETKKKEENKKKEEEIKKKEENKKKEEESKRKEEKEKSIKESNDNKKRRSKKNESNESGQVKKKKSRACSVF